jgi:hypothetical protein
LVAAGLPSRAIPIDVVLTAVARAFDVSLEALTTAERRRSPEDARAAAIILLADLCQLTSPQIGGLVGDCEPAVVVETIAQKDRLLLDPVWAGLFFDAVEDVTGVRPVEPPPILAYQGHPVRILEAQERSVLLQFVGRTPPGFAPTTRIRREMLRPAPDLGPAARALEDFLVWARLLAETECAWPDLARQVRAAEQALTILLGKTLPSEP